MSLRLIVAILCLTFSVCQSQDNCLGPGFTQTIPATQEWSTYSNTVLKPGDRVIYSTLSFACNGTLQSLTIPYEVSGYTRANRYLYIWVSVWRFNGIGYYRVRESRARVFAFGVMRKNFTTFHEMEVHAKDVLAFRLPGSVDNSVLSHVPLLFKPGPSPGTFIPIVSANFTASSGPLSVLPQTSLQPIDNSAATALGVLFALSLLLLLVLTVVVVLLAVMLKRARSGSGSDSSITSSLPVGHEASEPAMATVPSRMTSGTQLVNNRIQQCPISNEAGDPYQYTYVPSSSQRRDPTAIYGTVETENIYSTLNDGHYEVDVDVTYWSPAQTTEAILDQMSRGKYLEIPFSSVKKGHALGEGEFGEVFKGEWTTLTTTMTVALKSLKSSASDEERLKLLQEAAIMGQFNHPHIVRLYGVVTLSDPVMIVSELLDGGDLRNHLLKVRTMTQRYHLWGFVRSHMRKLPEQLLRFCQEIAGAMEYLSRKGFIHRDLAARNILLTTDMICKLADFGMSLDMDEDYYYYKPKGGMIPVKWTAPESIMYRRYTTKSDVWSYGMVMYEIWSLGHRPFEEFSTEEVVQALNNGYSHPPPPGCSRGVYAVMVKCWNPDYHSRVSFTEVVQSLNYDQRSLLKVDPRDKTGTPLSLTLGAPLEHGQELHKDLQDKYIK